MAKNVDRKGAVQKLKKLVLTPKGDLDQFRRQFENTLENVFLPNHVEHTERDYGGVKCDVLVPEVYSSRKIIIYIHGGSFVAGSRESYRVFCSSLANAAACRVVVPEFRLPPTHPFPAGIEDIQNVFRFVYSEEEVAIQLEKKEGEGESHPQIIIASDSSGATMACALVFNLNEKFRSCISNMVLFSPWFDLSSKNELIAQKKVHDEVISGADLHRAVDLYTYASNIENPLVSPLRAGDEKFNGFPEVYIQMGEKEILLKQALSFKKRLEDCNGRCIMDVCPDMMYLFQMADEFLPDSHLALERVGEYIRKKDELSQEEQDFRLSILKKNDIH